jgi:hypothetical protein
MSQKMINRPKTEKPEAVAEKTQSQDLKGADVFEN